MKMLINKFSRTQLHQALRDQVLLLEFFALGHGAQEMAIWKFNMSRECFRGAKK